MKEIAKKENQITEVSGNEIQLALLEVVKNPNIDPERLEKFLDLQIKMEERQAAQALNAALADFQSRCPIIQRTKTGHNNKKYAPLEDLVAQIQGLLLETGLSFSFDVEPIDEKTNCMKTIIRHRMGGQFVSLYYFPKSDASGNKNEAQGIRSANSYAKRTSLENALGIVTANEDLDGGFPKKLQDPKKVMEEVKSLLKETNADIPKFLKFIKAESVDSLTPEQAEKALHALKQKRKKQ